MDEETTKDLHDKKSFEERVLARFDSIDVRLQELESRKHDTKPIWEQALQAIMDTGLEVGEIKSKVSVIEHKVEGIETKVEGIETRLGTVEGVVAGLRSDYGNLGNELLENQRDFKVKIARRIDLVLETLVDTHESMRNSDERLTRLESKLA